MVRVSPTEELRSSPKHNSGALRRQMREGRPRVSDAVDRYLSIRIEQIIVTRVLPDLIEGDIRRGDRRMLGAALGRLAEHVELIRTPVATALLLRSEALAATGEEAEGRFRRAIDLLSSPEMPFELAKTHLQFGEWLRRHGRRRESRRHLQTAYEAFVDIGIDHLAERARIEIDATGEKARRRTYDTLDDLTPQETQVARMVATGAHNAEIAAGLFISPATVEYHLSKVYRKLGIDSRAKLVRWMLGAGADSEAVRPTS